MKKPELPFPTTVEQRSYLPYYMARMQHSRVYGDHKTLLNIWKVANEDQGMFELVEMWIEHENAPDEQWADFSAMLATLKDYGL